VPVSSRHFSAALYKGRNPRGTNHFNLLKLAPAFMDVEYQRGERGRITTGVSQAVENKPGIGLTDRGQCYEVKRNPESFLDMA